MTNILLKEDSAASRLMGRGFIIGVVGGVIAFAGDFFNIAPIVLLGAPMVIIGTLMGVCGVVMAWFQPINNDGKH